MTILRTWPNRWPKVDNLGLSLFELFAHFSKLLLKIFGATLKKTGRESALETRLRISLGKAIWDGPQVVNFNRCQNTVAYF